MSLPSNRELRQQLFKNLRLTYQGWWEWHKLLKIPGVDGHNAIILLPDCNKIINYCVLLYLDLFLDANGWDYAVLLTHDNVVIKTAQRFSKRIVKVVPFSRIQAEKLMQYDCLFQFDARFLIASIDEPAGRSGSLVLEKKRISTEELFVMGIYKLTPDSGLIGPPARRDDEKEVADFLNCIKRVDTMPIQHIVVQAGGKGSRMKRLTRNKPKALVPVDNIPILFHLFNKFPKVKFTIIGDYKCDVLEKYLSAFAKVEYQVVRVGNHTGTCAGLKNALENIPANTPFLLIWSDLILPEEFHLPQEILHNYIGIARDFQCRWKYENEEFMEEASSISGVAGLFILRDKSELEGVPEDGELVRWLSEQDLIFKALPLYHTKEYGLFSEYDRMPKPKCRPFNQIRVEGDWILKEGIDEHGRLLAEREVAWYQKLMNQNFKHIPQIKSLSPLCMERIQGKNVYEYNVLNHNRKKEVLVQIIECLKSIHALENVPSDQGSYYEAYIGKTFDRLSQVRDLIPFADKPVIRINGRDCQNVFFLRKELEELFSKYYPEKFYLIHGDCTFSNILLRDEDLSPVLIDPRGYFGTTKFYGDQAYEWAKLYYSIVGNYDQFNLKRFDLDIREKDVTLIVESSGWESMEDTFFQLLDGVITRRQIKLIHAIIWLSLTSYAWEDYDSICGAFYNGLLYLGDAL